MKFRAVGAALTLTGLLLAVAPGMAHHEILAKFDDTKPTTLKGIVTLVDWRNPHVHVFINVPNAKGIEHFSPLRHPRFPTVVPTRIGGEWSFCQQSF